MKNGTKLSISKKNATIPNMLLMSNIWTQS